MNIQSYPLLRQISSKLFSDNGIAAIYFVVAIAATSAQLLKPVAVGEYTRYNNFLIFKHSFYHLLHHRDLYTLYLQEHWDYYKYSPTFAVLMFPFSWIPDKVGFFLWNILNASILFLGIKQLALPSRSKNNMLLFCIPELSISLQNAQSNALIAGMLLLFFSALHRQHIWWAALWVALSFYIKIFGLIALLLYLLFQPTLKNIFVTALVFIALLLIPLLLISPHELIAQYHSWGRLLQMDESQSIGLSVRGFLLSWMHIDVKNTACLAIGLLLLIAPLIRITQYGHYLFRLHYLSLIMLWIILFNHKAESPTFIIAIAGASCWLFSIRASIWAKTIMMMLLIFTQLSQSDLFPPDIRHQYFVPYVVKAVPCIVAFIVLLASLLIHPYNHAHQHADGPVKQ